MLDLSSLVSFCILGIIGWIIYKVYIWPFYTMRKVPGPPSDNPFYGNFKSLFAKGGEVPFIWFKKYGNVVKCYGIFNKPTVVVADPKIIQDIAVNRAYDFIKPVSVMANLFSVLGNGLFFAEGGVHKKQRKMMNPAFTHNNIKEMVPSFNRVTLTLKDLIEDKINVGESKVNLTSYLSKATLDIIGLVGFSYEFNSLTSSDELAEAYSHVMTTPPTTLGLFLRTLSGRFPFVRKIPIDEYKRFNNACKIIKRVSKQLVEDKYHEAKNNELNGKDLLSILINTNKKLPVEERLTNDELRNQIMTFMLAGHETTSTSVCWALYFLAQHPHEQDLLREELVKAFPDKSKFNPTFDEINSLEYLNCIVKETLRLNSPGAILNRTNIKDEVFDKYFIPKNTLILVTVSALHKSPSIWGPTAENFDPKRWLNPSLIKDISHLNYQPFYTGPRVCIGNKLALAEFKILLSMLIRNFIFQPVEGFHVSKRVFPINKPDPYLELTVSKIEA